MRIEGYIPHKTVKITVFKSGSRYLIKFENADFEIVSKLRDGAVSSFKEVRSLVDHDMVVAIEGQFAELYGIRKDAFARLKTNSDENWEEII